MHRYQHPRSQLFDEATEIARVGMPARVPLKQPASGAVHFFSKRFHPLLAQITGPITEETHNVRGEPARPKPGLHRGAEQQKMIIRILTNLVSGNFSLPN